MNVIYFLMVYTMILSTVSQVLLITLSRQALQVYLLALKSQEVLTGLSFGGEIKNEYIS